MKKKINIFGIAILMLVCSPSVLNAQVEKVFEREIDTEPYSYLRIDHKFGRVECINWDKEALKVEVRIDGDQKSIENLKEYLEVDFDVNGKTILLSTNYKTGNLKRNGSVDISVMMPAEINLEIANSFGSTYIEHVLGDTDLDCSFGDLKCMQLDGESNNISNKFGNLEIEYIAKGDISSKNGNLEIVKAGYITVESMFGNTEIGAVKHLEIEGKNGHTEIEEVVNLEFEGAFGSLEVGEVSGSLDVENSYGSTNIHNLESSSESVSVISKFGTARIGVDEEILLDFECKVAMGSFYFPEEFSRVTTVTAKMLSKSYEGEIGTGQQKQHTFLEAKNGDIIIYEK